MATDRALETRERTMMAIDRNRIRRNAELADGLVYNRLVTRLRIEEAAQGEKREVFPAEALEPGYVRPVEPMSRVIRDIELIPRMVDGAPALVGLAQVDGEYRRVTWDLEVDGWVL